MSVPDVTVVVAVYNTMPYLTTCLTSLVEQSIGLSRLEIVAVDDGSTDGSGAELDRFVARYPGTFRVLHQPNSGGPAAPSNRALDVATGRYVFFLGADDHLGHEALERLVAAADGYGSDVVLGKLVGAGGRNVHQAVFARSAADIGLFDSPLPWALSNTKLFRRELIERYGLRFPEELLVGSDQPFTLEACFRAARISVLADYDYYHAVRRRDASNITYRTSHEGHLHSTEAIMDFVAGLIGPGKERDAVLLRHFTWELGKLLEADFRRLDRPVQERVRQGIGALADRYLTDDIRRQLDVRLRVRLSLAQRGDLDDLLAVLDRDAQHGGPLVEHEDGRYYAAYRGFRDPRLELPDDWFEITDTLPAWAAEFGTTAVMWATAPDGARMVAITARSRLPELAARISARVQVRAGDVVAATRVTARDDGGVSVRAELPVDRLIGQHSGEKRLLPVTVQVGLDEETGTAALHGPRPPAVHRSVHRRGMRLYVTTVTTNHKGRLVIAIAPLTVGRVMGRLRRPPRQGGKQQP